MKAHIYNSDEILAMDDLHDLQGADEFVYQMTPDEIDWVYFVKDKYSIADYILEHLNGVDVTLDCDSLSKALDDDCNGYGKAVCLSDDTALQKIFFWCYSPE